MFINLFLKKGISLGGQKCALYCAIVHLFPPDLCHTSLAAWKNDS